MSDWVNVIKEGDLAEGGVEIVDVAGVEIAVFYIEGSYYAIEDVCSHDGGTLADGEVEGHEIECPRHGARFDLRTGKVTAPPAYEDVSVFPVRIQAGVVQVRDNRDD